MTQTADMAEPKKTTEKPAEPNEEQPTPPGDDEKYKTHILDVKGRKFKMSNSLLQIGDVESHPATRIIFESPYIEWLVYYLKDGYYNILRDESENIIITSVKSKYPPWNEDKQRDKKILSAFALKGWKRGDVHLLFKAVESAYFNHKDLNMHLYLPQLQVMEADGNKDEYAQGVELSEFQYAQIIMRDNHFISNYADEVFIYQNGVYRIDRKYDFITQSYRELAGDEWSLPGKNSVIAQIISESRVDADDINPDPNIINFINGLYDLRTGELSDHTPTYISTIQIPHAYLADAESSKVINDIISGILQPEDIESFKEFNGYSLTTYTNMKKTAFIQGAPDTGKSTLLEILQTIIGYDYCSIEPLEKLMKDRFSSFELKDKLLNSCDDVSAKTIFTTDVLKQLTGGGKHILGEKKHAQKSKFRNTTKHVFCGNELPATFNEKEIAYFKRWIIFVCLNVHKLTDADAKKINEIINSISEEEYSAFIKECLDAFRGVMERGYFTLSKSNQDIEHKYRILSNPVGVFIEECTQGTGNIIKSVFLYAYNEWAKENDAIEIDSRSMGKIMGGKNGLGYKDGRETTTSGMQLHVWYEISMLN